MIPFRKARSLEIHVSGGEYNVAANLSDCFGLRTGIATAMVNYPIGELVQARVRETGVTPFYKWFEHDGVRGPNIATVYSDRGHGRPPAGRLLQPRERGRRAAQAGRLRLGRRSSPGASAGSTPAASSPSLSETTADADHRGDAGRQGRRGDHLVRPELPGQALGLRRRRRAKGQQVIREIVGHVDALIGNEEDLQKGLGIDGPGRPRRKSKLDPDTFFELIERVVEQHPNIKLVATTLREVHSTNRHDWAAVLWLDGKRYVSPTCQLDVIDRIGGGDGFAAGLIYGLLAGPIARGGAPPRLGPRRPADHLPRRRHHGQARRRSRPSPRAARPGSSAETPSEACLAGGRPERC